MLAAGPHRWQLKQSKWVTLRLGKDALTDDRAESGEVLEDELACGIFVQWLQFEFGKPGAVEEAPFACPGSAQHADSGAGQPTCDESQHLSAGSVKPRQVIEGNQDLLSGCCMAQQCEGGVGYEQPVRS